MKFAIAVLTTIVAAVSAQNPPGCSSDFSGTFVIQPTNVTSAPGQFDKRQARTICGATPIVSLEGGVLTDQNGRTGSVVANSQFQFDNPVQEDALFTSGFSICQNSSLAVGGSTIFYQCLSGSFYNLYQQSQGKQCNEIYINTIGCEADGASSVSSSASTPATTATTASSIPSSTPTTLVSTSAAPAPPPATPTSVAAPYPVGNGTAPAPTATGTTSATGSPSPSAFLPGSGAATIVIGGNVVALVAAIAALAMF
ncbi:MAG: hypothetical protein L6R41_007281 [Letrouitia leprolyta]|nr:MAG: hypothetical protein L6R41_007281 [Letrouitia leprolyta]